MDELCIHEMNPDWCANCKGLKTPEEEENQEEWEWELRETFGN